MSTVTFRVDSYIVSGIAMFLFNFAFFSFLKLLTQSICSSTNLYYVYDKRLPLAPRRSRLGGFFGGPVGHPSIARPLSIVVAVYAVIVILIDFSVNGSSSTVVSPQLYRSVVQAHPQSIPIDIDYKKEFDIQGEHRFASRRLVALAEMHSCMFLNFSHHTMFSYAYRNLHLDKHLVNLAELPPGGVCVTSERFNEDRIMYQFKQKPFPAFNCKLEDAKVRREFADEEINTTAEIESKTCNIDILAAACIRIDNQPDHCGAVGTFQSPDDSTLHVLVLLIKDADNPSDPEINELRDKPLPPSDNDISRFAANVAYFSAVRFQHGSFNAMYMAISEIVENQTLQHANVVNTSEVDMTLALPVLVIVVVMFFVLAGIAFHVWNKFVYRKGRRKYNTFSSVEEILAMVSGDGFRKSISAPSVDRHIFLNNAGRPVMMTSPDY